MALSHTTVLSSKLEQCVKCLQTLPKTSPVQGEFVSQFKRFLKCFSSCLPDIQEAIVHPCNQLHRPKAWLCVSQMIKILRLFASHSMTRQTVWYLTEQLQWCVMELSHTLADVSSEPDSFSDSFAHLMDSALQLLNSNKGLISDTWQKTIHDLVCQAVTIAKVALHTDCKEINFTCQQLLLESDRLTKDMGPDSFQIDLLTHSLNTLEQRVNTAVLRLLLEVFSNPNRPLKQLIGLCGMAVKPRNQSDLDVMVAVLDAHIERILLVGQYAVACCESENYQVKMKCCLASLESIDNYLVPAVTAFYMEPDCLDKRALVKLLCDHWQEEVSVLHTHIDLIVDSQAFSKVTEKSMKEVVERLAHEGPFQGVGRTIVDQGLLLHKHLSSTPDSPINMKHLKLFKEALFQCQSILRQQTEANAAAVKINKIIRLVEYLTGYLDEFYCQSNSSTDIEFSATSNNSLLSADNRRNCNAFRSKSAYDKSSKLLNNTSVTDYNNSKQESIISRNTGSEDFESVKKTNTTEPKTPIREENALDLLTPYLNRVKERSTTLYSRTPRKFVQSQIMNDSSLVGPSECDSLAIDVTEILENLSKLAETLSSEQEDSIISQPNNTTNKPLVSSDLSCNVTNRDPVISLDSLDISLSQRLQDLQCLDNKIRILKLS